ncbi:MAG: DUF1565 domain-containing protein [Bdellovibrionota bacterium]
MRRYGKICFAGMMLLAVAAVPLFQSCGGSDAVAFDLFVDALMGDDANDGTQTDPFKTITHALSVAESGDLIKVAPGTYNAGLGEIFPIQLVAGVSLIGDVPNKGDGTTATTIQGAADSGGGNFRTLVGADGASIAGFTIIAGTTNGYYGFATGATDVIVANNTFSGSYGGIDLDSSNTAQIERNVFETDSYGCSGVGDPTIENNEFVDGAFGIDLLGDSAAVLTNTFADVSTGILTQNGVDALIEGNTFTANSYNPAVNIQFDGAPTLRDNDFQQTSGTVISISDSAAPDLGTGADAGGNVFGANTAVMAINSNTSADVNAIGNTFLPATPVCGDDILTPGDGVVVWGAGADQQCPFPVAVTASDQTVSLRTVVTVATAKIESAGWLAIYTDSGNAPDALLGKAQISAGTTSNITVEFDTDKRILTTQDLWARLHIDGGAIGTFEPGTTDTPVLDVDEVEVRDKFAATVGTGANEPADVRVTLAINGTSDYVWAAPFPSTWANYISFPTTSPDNRDPTVTLATTTAPYYRFEIVNSGGSSHPFQLVFNSGGDTVLLGQSAAGTMEADAEINWQEVNSTTVRFSVDDTFGGASGVNAYRCGVHTGIMRGTIAYD